MAPDSDTRTSKLRSAFLNTVIFKISPGASRYSGCARTGAAPVASAQRYENATHNPSQRKERFGYCVFGLTMMDSALIILLLADARTNHRPIGKRLRQPCSEVINRSVIHNANWRSIISNGPNTVLNTALRSKLFSAKIRARRPSDFRLSGSSASVVMA